MHYLPQGDESSPRGSCGICAPALPEVLTDAVTYYVSSFLSFLVSMMKLASFMFIFERGQKPLPNEY
jgi:hypothetical protein